MTRCTECGDRSGGMTKCGPCSAALFIVNDDCGCANHYCKVHAPQEMGRHIRGLTRLSSPTEAYNRGGDDMRYAFQQAWDEAKAEVAYGDSNDAADALRVFMRKTWMKL